MRKYKETMGILCACTAVTLCCVHLVSGASFSGGTGKSDDPYQIRTPEQLISIGSDPNLLDKYFVLLNDVDLDPNLPGGQVFSRAVIAPDINDAGGLFEGTPFTGRLDGKDHTIRRLTVRGGSRAFLGLFGSIGRGGQVRNLRIGDAHVSGARDCRYLGILAGYVEQCTVVNCAATGRVTGGDSTRSLGGLVGFVWFDSRIIQCSSSCDISGGDYSKGLGGIAGENGGEVTNCYASGSVSSGYGSVHIGGLVGLDSPSSFEPGWYGAFSPGLIVHCYSIVHVSSGPSSMGLGGLVGQEEYYYPRVVDSLWDIEASGLAGSAGGTGLSAAQMKAPSTYIAAGWDFMSERANGTADLWFMPNAGGYPALTTLSDASTAHQLGGQGTANDPYRIATVEDLGAISHYDGSACYRLIGDIDLSGTRWSISPICVFDGRFDGAGFVISNLHIRGHSHLGLFGDLGPPASVINLRVVDANIVGDRNSMDIGTLSGRNEGQIAGCQVAGSVSGGDRVGGLVGFNGKNGTVTDCHATGTVSGTNGGADTAGGLAGVNQGRVTNSYASVRLSGRELYTLGGLVGNSSGSIVGCYATGRIDGNEPLGGLVAWNDGSLSNSYASVDIHTREETSFTVGGLAGVNRGTVINSYSVSTVFNVLNEVVPGSGLIGRLWGSSTKGVATNCFWDTQATRIADSAGGGTGLATAQMQTVVTFMNAGWDLDRVWVISEGKDYPRLRWENAKSDN